MPVEKRRPTRRAEPAAPTRPLLARDYRPANRHQREESERFRASAYDDLLQRDKVSLDIFWLRDESREDSENLPEPDVLAQQIVENLEAALEQFRGVAEELREE